MVMYVSSAHLHCGYGTDGARINVLRGCKLRMESMCVVFCLLTFL